LIIRLLVTAFLTLTVTLCGCESKPVFNALDITGIQGYGNEFRLLDHNGKPRTLTDFRGKVVVMFFGYTHCPDVCPTTLAEMKQVMQLLGDDGQRLQVLFVTLDPVRDTPELLSKYVPSFHPTFLGLYGNTAETERVAKDFKITYRVAAGKTADSYTVDHSSASLVFDPQGNLRLFINFGLAADKIAPDIKKLLQ
jgi:protein SCO1/2